MTSHTRDIPRSSLHMDIEQALAAACERKEAWDLCNWFISCIDLRGRPCNLTDSEIFEVHGEPPVALGNSWPLARITGWEALVLIAKSIAPLGFFELKADLFEAPMVAIDLDELQTRLHDTRFGSPFSGRDNEVGCWRLENLLDKSRSHHGTLDIFAKAEHSGQRIAVLDPGVSLEKS